MTRGGLGCPVDNGITPAASERDVGPKVTRVVSQNSRPAKRALRIDFPARQGKLWVMTRVLVCIPTYDERDTLPTTLARLRATVPDADVLVVDDNSPDGTGQRADELAASDTAVHVLHRPRKAGLGAAYIAAFEWGLEQGYDVLVEMDADGSHQPEELPTLLAAIDDGADLVLGSRWVSGGKVENWPMSRLLLSRGGNLYTRRMLGIEVADATGGFRAYRAEVVRKLPLEEVASQGYCFQVDLAWQAVQAGFQVVEVPITFVERAQGYSKMNRAIVVEALWRVTCWGVASRVGRAAAHLPGRRAN
jgi:dolichol-phosphate mannosyltransferase